MCVFRFVCLRLVLHISSTSYIVTSGHHLLLVSRVLNTIWSFLTIIHTIFGRFPCGSNLTLSLRSHFFAYVKTQFGDTIKAVQCDNGCEFDNSSARTFFLTHGIHLRMSYPYTSPHTVKPSAPFVLLTM